jgi:hypothetical protein
MCDRTSRDLARQHDRRTLRAAHHWKLLGANASTTPGLVARLGTQRAHSPRDDCGQFAHTWLPCTQSAQGTPATPLSPPRVPPRPPDARGALPGHRAWQLRPWGRRVRAQVDLLGKQVVAEALRRAYDSAGWAENRALGQVRAVAAYRSSAWQPPHVTCHRARGAAHDPRRAGDANIGCQDAHRMSSAGSRYEPHEMRP